MARVLMCAAWVIVMMGACVPGCKGPGQRETTPTQAPTEETATTPVNADKTWTWPLNDERLAELRGMSLAERNKAFRELLPGEYQARRSRGPIRLDGELDEGDWTLAQVIRMRDVGHGTPAWYGTTVRMTWDDKYLYVAMECNDPHVVSGSTKHDETIWKEDCVEMLVDADGDGQGYVEIGISPGNVVYDAAWGDFRRGADWMAEPTWERFESGTPESAYDAEEIKSAVKVDGTLNGFDDTDKGYTVELAIPWSALADVRPFKSAPGKIDMTKADLAQVKTPGTGTTWRMNFVRSNPSSPMLVDGEQSAWSPTGGTIHNPSTFGQVRFVD